MALLICLHASQLSCMSSERSCGLHEEHVMSFLSAVVYTFLEYAPNWLFYWRKYVKAEQFLSPPARQRWHIQAARLIIYLYF